MCKHTTLVRVPIAADLSHTGEKRWDWKAVDACIAPLVNALNQAGIETRGCCCGHGWADGSILLQDGRELIVRAAVPAPPETEDRR